MATLADLPVGSVFAFATKVTDRGADTMTLDLLSQDESVQATIATATDGTITGQLLKPPDQIPVEAVTVPLTEGAVVVRDDTGETMVVRAVWLSPRGFVWSSAPDRRTVYTTAGWTVIGTATLD